jgi:adenylate cyclase
MVFNSKRNRGILIFWLVSWVTLANLFIFYRFTGINWAEEVLVFSSHEWLVLFIQVNIAGISAGFLFGFLELRVKSWNYLHRISLGRVLLIKSIGYLLVTIVVLFVAFYIAARLNGFSDAQALERVLKFYYSAYFIVILVYLSIHTVLLNFILQINDKFGPGNLLKIFLGRYYHPVEEDRIFVFIDLRSSTEYAEKLGHLDYSALIQDCFYDLTPIVEKYNADIYQYVGDEVVLSWDAQKETEYRKSVMSIFEFKRIISKRSSYYQEKYGLVPEFKAGMNAGKVTTAEVGIIKREIAHHGDAVNTASRIQEQCNVFNKSVLCSVRTYEKLQNSSDLSFEYLGQLSLKGKKAPISIYAIEYESES